MIIVRYLKIIEKQWRIVLICFVLVGLGSYIGSKLQTPIYQSTVLVEVALQSGGSQSSDYTSLLASDQLVQTESQLAVSDPVLREVASHYKGMTVDQLTKNVSSTVKLDTQLLEIDVQNPNPKQASLIANDIATTLKNQELKAAQTNNNLSQQQMLQDLSATKKLIDTDAAELAALQVQPNKGQQLAVLQADLGVLQQHYTQLQINLGQLELTEAQSANFFRVVQQAQPSALPVRPQVVLYTGVGLSLGLLLGIVLALLFDQLDTRIRTAESLTDLLGWPIFTRIWRVGKSDEDDIVNPKGHSINDEAYRILRTNVGFSSVDKPLHTLAVVSAIPQDGKSTIAANLAIFMAKAGKKTLLIDADLRRPTQAEKFGLSSEKMGLSNAILAFSHMPLHTQPPYRMENAEAVLEPYIHTVNIPNLRVMPSGPLPPNPSELLDSKAMDQLLLMLRYFGAEIVIFDTAPLLGLSDASILVAKMDGVLAVVDIARAKRDMLKQMQTVLNQSGARVLGCVVNKQRRNRSDSSYSYYYYYSSDGHRHEDNQLTQIRQHEDNWSTQTRQTMDNRPTQTRQTVDNRPTQVLQNTNNQRSNGHQNTDNQRSNSHQYADNQRSNGHQNMDNQHSNGHQYASNHHAQAWQIDKHYNLHNENFRVVSLSPLSPVDGEPFEENGKSS